MIDVLKIMIIEDRATDEMLIKRQALKYESKSIFIVAKDRATFLEKVDWVLPNLILADYHLSDYSGLDALMHVKEHKPLIPFIFVTGGLCPNDPIAKTVLELADGYVLKNELDTLPNKIGAVLEKLKLKTQLENKKYEVENEKKIKLLRAIEMLQQANDFLGKEDIIRLLKEHTQESAEN